MKKAFKVLTITVLILAILAGGAVYVLKRFYGIDAVYEASYYVRDTLDMPSEDITGTWRYEDTVYRFMEDGTGYALKDEIFIPVTWEYGEELDTYVIGGRGIIDISAEGPATAPLEYASSYKNGKLTLRMPTMIGMPEEFERTNEEVNDETYFSLIDTPYKERTAGDWTFSTVIQAADSDDFSGGMVTSAEITEGRMKVTYYNQKYDVWKTFEGPIRFIDETHFIMTGDFQILAVKTSELEMYLVDEKFDGFYVITQDGIRMYLRVFYNTCLMEKQG